LKSSAIDSAALPESRVGQRGQRKGETKGNFISKVIEEWSLNKFIVREGQKASLIVGLERKRKKEREN